MLQSQILPSLRLPQRYRDFLPRFYQLATVSTLSNMMVPLAGLFDSAFLGHLTQINQLAGVILASILFDYLYRVLKFLRNSTNAMAAVARGQKDQTGILLAFLRSGFVALSIAALILVLQVPIKAFGFALLSGTSDIETFGADYFNARIWGAPAVLLNFVLIGWFLGCEKKWIVLFISLVGNGANVALDYLLIMRWGWGSMGAGLATALSQYLALLVGLVGLAFSIQWQVVAAAFKTLFDRAALKATLALKGNILVRFLALISAYSIFTNLSAALGTQTLAENGLLLQIALLSQFTVQGVGMTAQTLIGNCKGKGTPELLMPILVTAIGHSVLIAIAFALLSILFPHQVFGLLTSHGEISFAMTQFVVWLLPLLSLTSVAFMLEGYFIGLKDGVTLRNTSLLSFGLGFLPWAALAGYTHSNHLLWLSLVMYMATLVVTLGLRLINTRQQIVQEV